MSNKAGIALVMSVVFIGTIVWFWTGWYDTQREQMPIRTEIEETVEILGVENRLVVIDRVGFFGGAGAGGMGAPQINAVSVEQFLEKTEEEIYVHLEPVYINHEQKRIERIDKVYSSFLKNGNVLLQYRDSHQMDGFWVESYNNDKVDFKWDNMFAVSMATIGVMMLGALCFIIIYYSD